MKLLIDRSLTTTDRGGITEVMKTFYDDTHLHLYFSLEFNASSEQGAWLAQRTRSLTAFSTSQYALGKRHAKANEMHDLRRSLAV